MEFADEDRFAGWDSDGSVLPIHMESPAPPSMLLLRIGAAVPGNAALARSLPAVDASRSAAV